MKLLIWLLNVTFVFCTIFEAQYSFFCPLQIDFEYRISLWEKDQWPVRYGTLLDESRGIASEGKNSSGVLRGSHDGAKIKGKEFDIDVEMSHSCTEDGKITCERWHFGYCPLNGDICKLEKAWTLDTRPQKPGTSLLRMKYCAGDGNKK